MFNILSFFFIVMIYGHVFYYWYLAYNGRPETFSSSKKRYYYLFLVSLFGVGLFLYFGFYGTLFFLPASWGSVDEHGDFISLREVLSALLGGMTSLYLHSNADKFEKIAE